MRRAALGALFLLSTLLGLGLVEIGLRPPQRVGPVYALDLHGMGSVPS